jgi:hypothetical protein
MASTGTYGFRLAPDQVVKTEILGLREVQRDLNKLGDDTKNEMKDTHKEAAEVVVMGAKRLVPYRTGALAASIRALATKSSGRVRAGSASVPYAGPIHFGWPARRIAPNPFIYDALDDRRDDIREIYEERIDELIRNYGLSAGQPLRQARAVTSAAGQRTPRRSKNKTPDVRVPDAFLRDKSGNIYAGIFDGKIVKY